MISNKHTHTLKAHAQTQTHSLHPLTHHLPLPSECLPGWHRQTGGATPSPSPCVRPLPPRRPHLLDRLAEAQHREGQQTHRSGHTGSQWSRDIFDLVNSFNSVCQFNFLSLFFSKVCAHHLLCLLTWIGFRLIRLEYLCSLIYFLLFVYLLKCMLW